MATKRRRKSPVKRAITRRRQRRVSELSASPRRRRSLSAGKTQFMGATKNAFSGAMGGVTFALVSPVVKSNTAKLIVGFGGAIGLSMLNYPFMSAGMAGATAFDYTRKMTGLNDDGDLQDVNYVDPSTLSDSGYMDDNGDAILQDSAGNAFALQDGEYKLCDNFSLQDDYSVGDDDYLNDDYSRGEAMYDNFSLQSGIPDVSFIPV